VSTLQPPNDGPTYETANFWVLVLDNGAHEVYQKGITHSTRCAQIGHTGETGLARAIAECSRREAGRGVRA